MLGSGEKGQAQPRLAPQPVERTAMWGRWGLTQLHKHFSEKQWGALGRAPGSHTYICNDFYLKSSHVSQRPHVTREGHRLPQDSPQFKHQLHDRGPQDTPLLSSWYKFRGSRYPLMMEHSLA